MDLPLISPDAPLPAFCRGERVLYGLHSLRELSRISEVSTSVLSRTERGLIMPSVDILFKWSAGIHDGQADPELWTTAIYAASATWPEEAQFLLVRYSDPIHTPEICWDLACQAVALQTMIEHVSDPAPAVVEGVGNYKHVGSRRYSRFASALQSPLAMEAAQAAWFSVFRQADPTVYAASVRYLLDRDAPLPDDSVEEQSVVWVWLVESVWIPNGQRPIRGQGKDEVGFPRDPLWRDLESLWPRLSQPTREALVTLARQSQV